MIVLSARSDAPDRERAFALGADQYLVKPFGFSEFLGHVREPLEPLDRAG